MMKCFFLRGYGNELRLYLHSASWVRTPLRSSLSLYHYCCSRFSFFLKYLKNMHCSLYFKFIKVDKKTDKVKIKMNQII